MDKIVLQITIVLTFTFSLDPTLGRAGGTGSGDSVNVYAGYRAQRYGSYYSTVYFSYSGGTGYARYNRVYKHQRNLYPSLYSYMFEWFKTEEFTTYQNTPSGYISVCKNYEANDNGTYLGIFTCPLPFVPQDHSYCCGVENAQYCCKFWDLPLNVAAVAIMSFMGFGIVLATVYIAVQLCINNYRTTQEKNLIKTLRRVGSVRRNGGLARKSVIDLYDRVHAESRFSEDRFYEEDEDNDGDEEYLTEVNEQTEYKSHTGQNNESLQSDLLQKRAYIRQLNEQIINNNQSETDGRAVTVVQFA